MDPSFQEIEGKFVQALTGYTPESLDRHPGGNPSCWNARQVVEHLILTFKRSGATFRERLEKGRVTQAPLTAAHRMRRLVVLRLGYFPPGQEAPAMVTPTAKPNMQLDATGLISALGQEFEAMDGLLIECERQFGKQRFATHQVLGPLSAAQWRRFHFVHSRHHLKQAQRAVRG